MAKYLTAVGAVLLTAVPALLLSACSSTSKVATSGSSSASSASTPESTSSASSSGAAPSVGGKPSMDDVRAGLLKVYKQQPGLTVNQDQEFATCMVPLLYKDLTPAGLAAAAASDPAAITSAQDKNAIVRDGLACHKTLKF